MTNIDLDSLKKTWRANLYNNHLQSHSDALQMIKWAKEYKVTGNSLSIDKNGDLLSHMMRNFCETCIPTIVQLLEMSTTISVYTFNLLLGSQNYDVKYKIIQLFIEYGVVELKDIKNVIRYFNFQKVDEYDLMIIILNELRIKEEKQKYKKECISYIEGQIFTKTGIIFKNMNKMLLLLKDENQSETYLVPLSS